MLFSLDQIALGCPGRADQGIVESLIAMGELREADHFCPLPIIRPALHLHLAFTASPMNTRRCTRRRPEVDMQLQALFAPISQEQPLLQPQQSQLLQPSQPEQQSQHMQQSRQSQRGERRPEEQEMQQPKRQRRGQRQAMLAGGGDPAASVLSQQQGEQARQEQEARVQHKQYQKDAPAERQEVGIWGWTKLACRVAAGWTRLRVHPPPVLGPPARGHRCRQARPACWRACWPVLS